MSPLDHISFKSVVLEGLEGLEGVFRSSGLQVLIAADGPVHSGLCSGTLETEPGLESEEDPLKIVFWRSQEPASPQPINGYELERHGVTANQRRVISLRRQTLTNGGVARTGSHSFVGGSTGALRRSPGSRGSQIEMAGHVVHLQPDV
ncbi:unnamed protein product [Arctogadus glacialis]